MDSTSLPAQPGDGRHDDDGFWHSSGRRGTKATSRPFLSWCVPRRISASPATLMQSNKRRRLELPDRRNGSRNGGLASEHIHAGLLAYALGGDRENALKAATELENISTVYPYTPAERRQSSWISAKIHLALKDYSKALEAIDRGKDTLFGSFAEGCRGHNCHRRDQGRGHGYGRALPREFVHNKVLFEVRTHQQKPRPGYDKLLGIPQTKDNGDLYWVILFDRGRIAEKDGNPRPGGSNSTRKAVDVIEGQRATLNTEASKNRLRRRQAGGVPTPGRRAAGRKPQRRGLRVRRTRAKSRALVDMLAAKQDFPAIHTVNAQQVRTLLAQVNTTEAESRASRAATRPSPASAASRSSSKAICRPRRRSWRRWSTSPIRAPRTSRRGCPPTRR